jgi:hypothetical protein
MSGGIDINPARSKPIAAMHASALLKIYRKECQNGVKNREFKRLGKYAPISRRRFDGVLTFRASY